MTTSMAGSSSHSGNQTGNQAGNQAGNHRGALIAAATLLGIGLGGFVDGILFHQILQWHNMVSHRVPPLDLVRVKYNMVWDGLFHAFTWVMTMIGLAMLWRAGQRHDVPWSTRTFVGSLLLGWGLFNFVEGVIDHHFLELHHVHPGFDQAAWDYGFLLSGVVLIATGWRLIHLGRHDTPAQCRRLGPNAVRLDATS